MSERKSVLQSTQVVLNITLVVFAVLIAGSLLTAVYNPDYLQTEQIVSIVTTLIVGFAVFKVIWTLKKIVHSVDDQNPFTKVNVHRFKTIGWYVIGLGICIAVISFPARQSGAVILGTPYGSIGPEILIFLVLGCTALLLAEIFAQAVEMKNENDMTI